ncbi:MAG TPA: GNAT family N-acetyltransferase [Ornithinibacter sp.]|nr:GNAT family N-acetyltransferase [Ornithinibacter sp.]
MTATRPLRGHGLVLEPLVTAHAGEMVGVLSDAALYRFTGGAPPTLAELEGRYARHAAGSGDPAEEWHTWIVRLGDDGPAVGYVQATVRPADGLAELAWLVGSPWQGRGLARDAASVVLDEVAARGATRAIAHIHPDHAASQHVAAALGLEPAGRVVDGEMEWERALRRTSVTTPSGIVAERGGPVGAPPVVLLHAGVADRRMWEPQWAGLTAVRDAVRLDLRGFGESARRPAGALDHVADVLEVLDVAGVGSCHLVGSSFGAGVAVEVALTRPDLVRSLVLAPPGGSLFTAATPDLLAFAAAEHEALAVGDLDAAVEANIATWVVGPTRDAADVAPAVVAAVRAMQRRAFEVTEGWDDLEEVELDPPAVDRLADLHRPVLLVVGGHDLDATRLAAARLEAVAPHVRRVDVPDAAHLPSMESPDGFLDLVLAWVAEHD